MAYILLINILCAQPAQHSILLYYYQWYVSVCLRDIWFESFNVHYTLYVKPQPKSIDKSDC